MAIDGTYSVEVSMPRGNRPLKITLKSDGSSLSGAVDGPFGKQSISEGKVNGNELYWKVRLKAPEDRAVSGPLGMQTGELLQGMVRFITDSFRENPIGAPPDDAGEETKEDFVIEFNATLDGDDMSGKMQFGPYATGTFKGSRS
jgi:hypothetical protein